MVTWWVIDSRGLAALGFVRMTGSFMGNSTPYRVPWANGPVLLSSRCSQSLELGLCARWVIPVQRDILGVSLNYPPWSTQNSLSGSSPLFKSVRAHKFSGGLLAHTVKNLPAMQETWVLSLGWEDLLEKEMATHSSFLAWGIPWTEKPGKPQSMGSQSWTRLSDQLQHFTQ